MSQADELRARMIEWDRGAWCLAALALALRPDASGGHADAARNVLTALGVDAGRPALGPELSGQISAMAAAPLVQTATVLAGGSTWDAQTDEALLAQGRTSAQATAMFAQFVLPHLAGLADRFAAPGARMLDVGVGTAAMAVSYAEAFPELTVVGIDVMPRVLALAEQVVAASHARDRVLLRNQDVATIGDSGERFDLVWLPAPFLPPEPLHAGVRALSRALVPGGWVMVGHGKFGNDPLEDAINSFKTVAFGGTALDDEAAQRLLTDAGLVDVHTMPTPPGAPALTFGRAAD